MRGGIALPPREDELLRQAASTLAGSGTSIERVDRAAGRLRLVLGEKVVTGAAGRRVDYASHLGFDLSFVADVDGALRLDARVADDSPLPWHPHVDSVSGRWRADSCWPAPGDASGWLVAFVDSLLYAFAPEPLGDGIANTEAAAWYAEARRRQGLLPTGTNPFRRSPPHPATPAPAEERLFQPRTYTPLPPPVEIRVPEPWTQETVNGSRHQLLVLGEAARVLLSHVGWGAATAANRVEQGGILVGEAYRDSERGMVYGLVDRALPGHRAYGSPTYVDLRPDDWKDMLDRAELTTDGGRRRRVLGWYHTHPNGLAVFMSGTDRSTQRRVFAEDWHFALVLNPHRQEAQAFHGADAERCSYTIDPHRAVGDRHRPRHLLPVEAEAVDRASGDLDRWSTPSAGEAEVPPAAPSDPPRTERSRPRSLLDAFFGRWRRRPWGNGADEPQDDAEEGGSASFGRRVDPG